MNSRERVICALSGGTPDRVPFAEHYIDSSVLNILFGQKAKCPVYVADQLGLDVLSFTLVPQLFVETTTLPDGRIHQTSGKLHTRTDLALLETLENPCNLEIYEELDTLISRRGQRAVVGRTRLGLSPMLMSMDLTGFSMALADDPQLIVIILKRYIEWFKIAVHEMTKRGIDLIWCFDDFAYNCFDDCSDAKKERGYRACTGTCYSGRAGLGST